MNDQRRFSWPTWLVGLWISLALVPLRAATQLYTDDFEDRRLRGWSGADFGQPFAPRIVRTGGPDGDADAFLMLSSSGGNGQGSRIATYNRRADWIGDFASAGITSIEVDMMSPIDSTELEMRLVLFHAADRWTSVAAQVVPNDGQWRHYSFPIASEERDACRTENESWLFGHRRF